MFPKSVSPELTAHPHWWADLLDPLITQER